MDERRAKRRGRTLKSGKIILGKRAVPCTVHNLSETGARLKVQTTFGIPATFEFSMPGQPTRICKVAWLDDTTIGVQFR